MTLSWTRYLPGLKLVSGIGPTVEPANSVSIVFGGACAIGVLLPSL